MARAPRPEHLTIRLSSDTRALIEEIKRRSGLTSDAEVIRSALALHHHIASRMAEGRRVFLADATGQIDREVTLGGQT